MDGGNAENEERFSAKAKGVPFFIYQGFASFLNTWVFKNGGTFLCRVYRFKYRL
jgi:hypothetical protein